MARPTQFSEQEIMNMLLDLVAGRIDVSGSTPVAKRLSVQESANAAYDQQSRAIRTE